jgi:3-deoxy-D-manno-octulosonic-acid transferase
VKRLLDSKAVVSLVGALGSNYIRLIEATSEVRRDPPDTDAKLLSQHPQIFAMWHGQGLMLPRIKPKTVDADVAVIVGKHRDGEIMGSVLKRFGLLLIRGAGAGGRRRDRGGAGALRGSLRALKDGATVAMTADVPPGPARRAGLGIVTLARMSGRPIVPCAMATGRFIATKSWSAFTINLPFSKLGIVVGDPIHVPEDADDAAIETARQEVERRLNAATERAYALVGAEDPLPARKKAPQKTDTLSLKMYRALTGLAAPFVPLMLAWRTKRGKEEKARLAERSGNSSLPRPPGFLTWFHAASVGEANAALPVIEAMFAERPEAKILLTTGTVTSARLARSRLPKGAMHQYVPLDRQAYVQRFLSHWQPDLAVFVESEIWPNLVLETKARNIPLILVNGRMSSRSFRRWLKRPGFSKPLFSAFTLVLAQNGPYAERFSSLGSERTVDAGNLKADAPPPPLDLSSHRQLATALSGRPVWLAASTHAGEDDLVALAHLSMKRRHADLLTVIVPRHPERGPDIAKMLEAEGMRVALRSEGKLPDPAIDIYIADTIGELGLFYNLVGVAFVGGSLVPHGGQNPVEAIKLGAAVLTGPHVRNFADSYEELIQSGGCVRVEDAESLAAEALRLLDDAQARATLMSRAEAAIARMGGALPRTLAELEVFLPPKATLQHAS